MEVPGAIQEVLDALTAHVAVLDGHGAIVTVNGAWRRFAAANGASPAAIGPGVSYLAACTPAAGETSEAARRGIEAVLAGEREAFSCEYPCHAPDEERWFLMNVRRLGGGRPGAVVSHEDVSALRRTSEEARARAARLQAVFASPGVGIAVTSPQKGWLEVNDRLCDMFGYTRDEICRKTWLELTHPDDVAADVARFDEVVRGEIDRYSLDKRFLRRDGSILWAILSVSCVRRADGGVEAFVAVLKDIGPRKEAEAALRRSEARLGRVLDGSADGFGDFEAATGLVTVTPRYCEIYGFPVGRTEVPVEELMARVYPEDLPAIERDFEELRDGRLDAHLWEYRILRSDGAMRWIQSRGKVVGRDEAGLPVHVSGAITDVTERRTAEEGLRAALAMNERLVADLREALQRVRTLSGLLPICMYCKKIRDDAGYWNRIEQYLAEHTDARFSHGMCEECFAKHHGG